MTAGHTHELVTELAAAGVDMLQLREKDMEAGDLIQAGEPIRDACRAAGIAFIVNDRADVALALGADGLHVGQNDLSVGTARRFLGGGIVGLSTHSQQQIDGALLDDPDYIAVGPVFATPTKPGRPPVGLDPIGHAAARVGLPWFAIGGIDATNLSEVLDAGARRVVVVRAIADAPDPVTAAKELRALIDVVPLKRRP